MLGFVIVSITNQNSWSPNRSQSWANIPIVIYLTVNIVALGTWRPNLPTHSLTNKEPRGWGDETGKLLSFKLFWRLYFCFQLSEWFWNWWTNVLIELGGIWSISTCRYVYCNFCLSTLKNALQPMTRMSLLTNKRWQSVSHGFSIFGYLTISGLFWRANFLIILLLSLDTKVGSLLLSFFNFLFWSFVTSVDVLPKSWLRLRIYFSTKIHGWFVNRHHYNFRETFSGLLIIKPR